MFPKLTAEQKKPLVAIAVIVTLVVIYQASMTMIFQQPPPIKELAPFVAFIGSAIIAVLVAARVYKDLK